MRPFLLFCLLSLFLCGPILAHKDSIIHLGEDKALVGLPNEYMPAELDLQNFRLKIKNNELKFSPFLKSLFLEPYDLRVSASWYHEKSLLPSYLLLHIQPRKKDFGYEILLNLDTLDVISVTVLLKESDSATRHLPIDLSRSNGLETRLK